MSSQEIIWRLSQKTLELDEKVKYSKSSKSIINIDLFKCDIVRKRIKNYNPSNHIFINNNKKDINPLDDEFLLFNRYKIKLNEKNWNKGFNTENSWPFEFSYSLFYKQNDDIGDARINWELNRHYHLTILSKNYYVTREKVYYDTLKDLFYNWADNNRFLIGISWTSVMEVAIRAFSWIVILSFLEMVGNERDNKFKEDLKIGILNQIEYVSRHYSRYSSANNHLIVEMVMMGITGVLFEVTDWIEISLIRLEEEINRQIHEDGVNKEQGIHYHTFVMEALFLYIITLKRNNIVYPEVFDNKLKKMCEFIADIMDCNSQVPDIGDSDEGKLLDLVGQHYNHFKYVLQLGSVIYNIQYDNMNVINENIYWLFRRDEIKKNKNVYIKDTSVSYKKGGYSILKYLDDEKERILTFDHGELGFGAIAAHGHADALSITLAVDGEKILVDPGTYIYHIKLNWRNYFKKTINHNTITVNNRDQSEIKGAFLWGNRANSKLIRYSTSKKEDRVFASHDGYFPIIHQRNISYLKPDLFIIEDMLLGDEINWILTYMVNSHIEIDKIGNIIKLNGDKNFVYLLFVYEGNLSISIDNEYLSKIYASKERTQAIRLNGTDQGMARILTFVSINEKVDLFQDKENLCFSFKKKKYSYNDNSIERY